MGLEKDIKLGSAGDVDLALVGGQAVIKLKISKKFDSIGMGLEGDIVITQDAKPLLDKLVALVPAGWVHDALAAGEKAALAATGALDHAAAPAAVVPPEAAAPSI